MTYGDIDSIVRALSKLTDAMCEIENDVDNNHVADSTMDSLNWAAWYMAQTVANGLCDMK